ncbi:PEP-CTERM sorting domain-containing protein [Stieleria sp. ICT_E10.1]|uniref:PEP-CTERM sorting domain-containing protein n=1 Tax=Stieleria sedimenti TaxID=2976331 RepID=UPI00217F4B93|nr:PEP-CTERM sorting domain-containing protein [Stieleria sedimenti]MCS7465415.1 PEP-CTERM sorting domain-containing protein [Stieleria sedimenti]
MFRRSLIAVAILGATVSCLQMTASAQVATDAKATDFAIYAGQMVTLDTYSTVLGDVYARENISVEFGYGIQRPSRNRGNFYAVEDIVTTSSLIDINGDLFANRDISFNSGTDVIGNATYGRDISANASSVVTGTVTQASNTVASIAMPHTTDFVAGSVDYNLAGQEVVNLAPGSYRSVDLSGSSLDELHLTSGDYFLRNLTLGISTDLYLDLSGGQINVYVEDDVDLGTGLQLYINGTEFVDPGDNPPPSFVDLASEVTWEVHGDFEIGSGFLNEFFGTVYTPDGNISVDTQAFYGSMIAGRNVSGDFYLEHYASSRLTAIPEPSAALVLLLGGMMMIRSRRRVS